MAASKATMADLKQAMIDLSISVCEDIKQRKTSMTSSEIERMNALTSMYLALINK